VDITKCAGQREQSVGTCGPQNEAQNETNCAKVFKMLSTDELTDITVRETNTYAEQISEREASFHFFLEFGTGNLLLRMKCML
jgi:hypothetical protein